MVLIALSVAAEHALSKQLDFFATSVATSLAAAILYAVTLADVDEAPGADAWSRAFERAWAVILIDFFQNFITLLALGTLLVGGVIDRFGAIILLLFSISMNFSDVDAVVSDDDRWWFLIPAALTRSMLTTWSSGPIMLRAMILFLTGLVSSQIDKPVWLGITVSIVVFIPLSILTTHVYLDAIGYESKRTCSE